jgi:hypothetical protein
MSRSKYLGPTGPDVEVEFSTHGLGRLIERLQPGGGMLADEFELLPRREQERVFQESLRAGLPFDAFCRGVRNPNTNDGDRLSHAQAGPNSRYIRRFRMDATGPVRARAAVRTILCEVVFVIERQKSDQDPGSIVIVSVLPPKP